MPDNSSAFPTPAIDASRHRPLADLEAALRSLPRLPPDTGRVALIVRRPADDRRETPARATFTVEDGLPGDSWGRRSPRHSDAQLTVMRREVAEFIAHGQPLTLFGDNLFVDFDISLGNLPIGSRLRVGTAVMEVTPMPHNGCRKFHARFGADALGFVNAKPTRDQNLRGIYWKVIEPGEIAVGDPISLLSRSPLP